MILLLSLLAFVFFVQRIWSPAREEVEELLQQITHQAEKEILAPSSSSHQKRNDCPLPPTNQRGPKRQTDLADAVRKILKKGKKDFSKGGVQPPDYERYFHLPSQHHDEKYR